MVTHDIALATRISDRIALLRDGVITAQGTVREMEQSRDPFVQAFLHGTDEPDAA